MAGFQNPDDVSGAAAKHEEVREQLKSIPAGAAVSAQVSATMADMESVFYTKPNAQGNCPGAKISDDVVEFVLDTVERSGISREIAIERIRAVGPGQYFSEDLKPRKVYFKTPDGKVQEASAYVARVEKSTIAVLVRLQRREEELEDALIRRNLAEGALRALHEAAKEKLKKKAKSKARVKGKRGSK